MKRRAFINAPTSTLSMAELKDLVLKELKSKHHISFNELAEKLSISPKYVLSLVMYLRGEGHKIRSVEGYLFID